MNVFTVTQIARQLGVTSVTVTTRIKRNALPAEVTAQKVGNSWNIYVPSGKKIQRQLEGSETEADRPGRNCKWVLVEA